MVSQPVPISAAPMERLKKPSSLSLMVAEPTSTPEMPEPCIAMATPAARTFPLPISRTGNFSSQWKSSLHRVMHRSRAQASARSL